MNLIRAFALLVASVSIGEARILSRKLGGPPQKEEDKLCNFDFEQWFCTTAFCPFEICAGGDQPLPKACGRLDQPLVNFALWKADDQEGTIQCLPAKGYRNFQLPVITDDVENNVTDTIQYFHGHGIQLWGEEDRVADDIKNVQVPGAYYMQGGVVEVLGQNCTQSEDGVSWSCEPEERIIKATGRLLDLCYAMGATSTHCDGLTAQEDCKGVNTCRWVDGVCTYVGHLLDKPCTALAKMGECKAAGCAWEGNKKHGQCLDAPEVPEDTGDVALNMAMDSEEEAVVEEPKASATSTRVPTFAFVPMLMILWQ